MGILIRETNGVEEEMNGIKLASGTTDVTSEAEKMIEKALGENLDKNAIETFLDNLPEKALNLGIRVVFALILLFIGHKLIKLIRKIAKKSLNRINAEQGLIQFLDSMIKVLLYLFLIMMIGSYFGLDTASVIAVIGSAGVAIGLAIQGSLSNFAGGVLILLLKPFKVGDYIIEDGHKNEGTVAEITLFYTKLKTLDNRIVVLPNGNLANTSLTNVTGAQNRMLILEVGISYSSDMKLARQTLYDLAEADEAVKKDRKIVTYVSELGDSAVVIGARFWVPTDQYWAVKWRMTEKVKEVFDEKNIEIPFNQLDVHVN